MSSNAFTVVGNLTADPELRFTASGAAVVNFTIASTPRHKNAAGDWVDGDTLFMKCTIWRQAAENVAESLRKGNRVIATGKLASRTFETREGEKRTVVELDVDEVGPSLKNATAVVSRTVQASGMGFQSPAPMDDPWAAPAKAATLDQGAVPF